MKLDKIVVVIEIYYWELPNERSIGKLILSPSLFIYFALLPKE